MKKLLISSLIAITALPAFAQDVVTVPDGFQGPLKSYGTVNIEDLISPPNLDNDPANEIQFATGDVTGTGTRADPWVFTDTDTVSPPVTVSGGGIAISGGTGPTDPYVITHTPSVPVDADDTTTLLSITYDATNNQYTTTGDDGGTAVIAGSNAAGCEITAATGFVSDLALANFIDRGLEFDSAALSGSTQPCNNGSIVSTNTNASTGHTLAFASINGTIGARFAAVQGLANTVGPNGLGSVAFNQSNEANAQNNSLTGVRNVSTAPVTSLHGTDVTASAGANGTGTLWSGGVSRVDIKGTQNAAIAGVDLDIGGANNLVSGRLNTVADALNVQSNFVTGNENVIVGTIDVTKNVITGQRGQVFNNVGDNYLTGNGNLFGPNLGQTYAGGTLNNWHDAFNSILTGRYVENALPVSITAGFSNTGPASTANRTLEFNIPTGDLRIAGAFTGSFAFPGLGEYAISEAQRGYMLRYVGEAGARLCEAGEIPHGVSRKKLAISPGGGIDPANSPYQLDQFGDRRMVRDEETGLTAPVSNDNYDAAKAAGVRTIGVEMLGRSWVRHDGSAKVGGFLGCGAGGVGTANDDGFEVLAMNDDTALVVVR